VEGASLTPVNIKVRHRLASSCDTSTSQLPIS
jgi:hypothetical protein